MVISKFVKFSKMKKEERFLILHLQPMINLLKMQMLLMMAIMLNIYLITKPNFVSTHSWGFLVNIKI